jgi:hypothetical protein
MNSPTPSKRGGKRVGAGRKPEGKKHYDVTLTETNVEFAKRTQGNLSGLLDTLLLNWIEQSTLSRLQRSD